MVLSSLSSLYDFYTLGSVIWVSYTLCCTIREWSKGPSKKPRDILSPTTIELSKLLSYAQPNTDNFVCMYSQFDLRKPCNGKPKKKKVEYAINSLYRTLELFRPNNLFIEKILHDCALHYLCHAHQSALTTSHADFWNGQIERWLQELRILYNKEANKFGTQYLLPGTNELPEASRASCAIGDERKVRQNTPDVLGGFPSSQASVDRSEEIGEPSNVCDDKVTEILEGYRSHFNHTSDVSPANTSQISRFIDYCSASDVSLSDLVTRRLSFKDGKPGTVYIYQSGENGKVVDREYFKIGYTNGKVEDRFKQMSKCGFSCNEVKRFETENAQRVESLVHKELQLMEKRRRDQRCFNNSNSEGSRCTTIHDEWFEITESEAIRVVQYWVKWMEFHKPYGDEGYLRPECVVLMYSAISTKGTGTKHKQANVVDAYKSFTLDSRAECWRLSDCGRQSTSTSSPRGRKNGQAQKCLQSPEDRAPVLSSEGRYDNNTPSTPARRRSSKQENALSPGTREDLIDISAGKDDDEEVRESYEKGDSEVKTPLANRKTRMPAQNPHSEPRKSAGGLSRSPANSKSPTTSPKPRTGRLTNSRRASGAESSASTVSSTKRVRSGRALSVPEIKSVEGPPAPLEDQDEAST